VCHAHTTDQQSPAAALSLGQGRRAKPIGQRPVSMPPHARTHTHAHTHTRTHTHSVRQPMSVCIHTGGGGVGVTVTEVKYIPSLGAAGGTGGGSGSIDERQCDGAVHIKRHMGDHARLRRLSGRHTLPAHAFQQGHRSPGLFNPPPPTHHTLTHTYTYIHTHTYIVSTCPCACACVSLCVHVGMRLVDGERMKRCVRAGYRGCAATEPEHGRRPGSAPIPAPAWLSAMPTHAPHTPPHSHQDDGQEDKPKQTAKKRAHVRKSTAVVPE
jgi:hypothetical protein